MGILELAETSYPGKDDPRPALGVSQFVQYNLDRSETIDDVIASDLAVRPFSPIAKMHYFACDASAACAVLQYVDGKLHAYRGAELPFSLLTNSPYPASAAAADACLRDPSNCPATRDSLGRYGTAALLRSRMTAARPFGDQALGVLESVAQSGYNVTRFQLLLDPASRTVRLRRHGTTDLGVLHVNFDDVTCAQPRRVIAIDATSSGDLAGRWFELTAEYQKRMVLDLGYPASVAEAYANFPFTVKCDVP